VTAGAQVAPVIALGAVLPWPSALALGALFWGLTAFRVQRLLRDPVRPRWVTRLFDAPMFAWWGAGVLALPLFLVGALVMAGAGLGGCGAVVGQPPASISEVAAVAVGVGALVSGWGLWGRRRWVRSPVVEVAVGGLSQALDGYRIAHLTDLHIGSWDGRARGLEWARRACELDADLVVVTGDLVTSGTAYHGDVAEVLGALRARDGVFVVLGNHDQWDANALARAVEARGPRVLRNAWVRIERAGGALTLAGVDDAYSGSDDIERTLAGRPLDVPTVLLAHYPDFFAHAVRHGVELTLSGHTHGGQFGVPFLSERFNVATALGQRPRGLFRRGGSALYVGAGLGTTGPPMRVGVAPEIALLVLRSSSGDDDPRSPVRAERPRAPDPSELAPVRFSKRARPTDPE
jgi:predicted MPP superfamily phosphohydrolase